MLKAENGGGVLIEVGPNLPFAAAGSADYGHTRRIRKITEDGLRGGEDGAAAAADRGCAAVGEEDALAAGDDPAGRGEFLRCDQAVGTIGNTGNRVCRDAGYINVAAAAGIRCIAVPGLSARKDPW